MKTVLRTILAMSAALAFSMAHAEQTVGEKAKDVVNDTGAAVSKGANRVGEEVCEMVDGKMKCLPKKAKNRAEEAGKSVKNKATEVKDRVD